MKNIKCIHLNKGHCYYIFHQNKTGEDSSYHIFISEGKANYIKISPTGKCMSTGSCSRGAV